MTPVAGAILDCPVLVVGGGTGGIAAGLAAARAGVETCVTEETDWVGGQFTAQGLNASDENKHIDKVGATRSFAEMRALMRAHYGGGASNPGECWVSHLCAEPKVALEALATMTKPAIDAGKLTIFYNLKPTEVETDGGRVSAVVLARPDGGKVTIRASQTIDATELGDVIKLSGAAYRVGQEPRSDTGEADAPPVGCPTCIQSITYCTVLERRPEGEDHVIAKPAGYGEKPWMKGFSLQEYRVFDAVNGKAPFWTYRRLRSSGRVGGEELSLINWGAGNDSGAEFLGGNDFPHESVVEVSDEKRALAFEHARERALAFVYWLQTEADGRGYPNLKLRSDVLGTTTGVAKYPYIREGRRLRALETVKAEDISDYYNPNSARARTFKSSVGIGLYPMDMHTNVTPGSGAPRGKSLPFQVPLGALIPETMNGLLAGAKNIGTTHLTNSAYRLHPIEWTIGEAAGTLAALSVSEGTEPRDTFSNERAVRALQDRLLQDGVPIFWIDDVLPSSPEWRDIQFVAAVGIMIGSSTMTLHFEPAGTLTRAQGALALARALELTTGPCTGQFTDVPSSHWACGAVEALASKGIILGTGGGAFSPDLPLTREQLRTMIARALDDSIANSAVPQVGDDKSTMTRGQAAQAFARTYRARLKLP